MIGLLSALFIANVAVAAMHAADRNTAGVLFNGVVAAFIAYVLAVSA